MSYIDKNSSYLNGYVPNVSSDIGQSSILCVRDTVILKFDDGTEITGKELSNMVKAFKIEHPEYYI